MSLSRLVPRFLLFVGILPASLSLDSRCQAQDTVARARPSTEATAAIRSALASEPEVLRRWYAARDHAPAWDAASVTGLTQFIENLDRHGLSPRLFDLDRWKASWNAWPTLPADQARLEIATTRLALHAIESLAYGFVDPTEVHSKWTALSRTVAPLALLEEGLRQGPERFPRWLEGAAAPPDPRYREMVSTLARYRQVASRGGWKSLPPSAGPVGPGQPYPHLTLLRARLQAEGDLAPAAPVKIRSKVLDPETTQALRSFQFRHGIAPDAVIGPQTLTELNQPVDRRLEAIVLNLDRLRWMPRSYEQAERLEVNIAEGALRLFQGGRSIDTMRVIVGIKGKHQTPVFHGGIRYLTFRPYWNVPLSIARSEVVPAALEDPGYAARENYEIVPGFGVGPEAVLPATEENLRKVAEGQLSIRQGTGPGNALGLVKFIFPNEQSVYLHDTPNHELFQATDRDFSHGCVRVSEPDRLAEFVLQPLGDWSLPTIQAAMKDETRPNHRVNLPKPLPVYLNYWTCTIMNDGRVRFDQDIYGHDEAMARRFGLRPALTLRAEPVAR